jgi:TrmH family RNA methyltransferase
MARALQTTIRDLHRRRARERRGLALAEGVRLVEEALASGIRVRGAVVAPALEATPRGRALKSELVSRGIPLEEVSPAELEELADTEHPQGVVAVVELRTWRLDDIPTGDGAVVLVLDAVQDPGNVGTILRTASGLEAAGVVALTGTADLANSKVLRGSMGALFRMPAVQAAIDDFLAWARERGLELWVSAADGDPVARACDTTGKASRPPLALVLGNEGAGVSPALEAVAARRVSIPLGDRVESLNVAVAAGILHYEVSRAE